MPQVVLLTLKLLLSVLLPLVLLRPTVLPSAGFSSGRKVGRIASGAEESAKLLLLLIPRNDSGLTNRHELSLLFIVPLKL